MTPKYCFAWGIFFTSCFSYLLHQPKLIESLGHHPSYFINYWWRDNSGSAKWYSVKYWKLGVEGNISSEIKGLGSFSWECLVVGSNLVAATEWKDFNRRTRIDRISDWPNRFRSTWTYLFKHTKRTPFVKPRGFGQSEIRSIRCLPF